MNKNFCVVIILSIVIDFVTFTDAVSQNGHFWTQHYGTRSMLLSGSVIGGVDDIGAIYYNPARLSVSVNPSLFISADVLELNTVKIEDTFGEQFDSKDSDFGSVPSLTAGTFQIPGWKDHYFAWAILYRHNDNFGFSYHNDFEEVEEFTDTIAEIDHYNSDLKIDNGLKEQWTGAGWAYPIDEKLSVGASVFVSRISQSKFNSTDFQLLTNNDQLNIYRFNKNISLTHYNLMVKIGASMILDKVIVGASLLLPGIKISGDASYRYEEFYSESDTSNMTPDRYTVNVQNDLNSKFKTPLGIGFGISFPYKKNKLHLSSEWFSGVSKYKVVNPEDHYSQSNGDTISFVLIDELKSILNFGIGFEWFINDKISGFASFSIDKSAAAADMSEIIRNNSEMYNSNMNTDFYHLGGGIVLSLIGADITLGATHTSTSQNFSTSLDIPNSSFGEIYDPDHESKFKWSRWRFIFSFSLPFIENKVKDIEKKFGL